MTAPARPIRVHSFPISGHAHRVRLFLSLLRLPHEVVDVDLAGGAHKAPPFLAMNPFGQVPVLEDGDVVIADSNAILVYLALRYDTDGQWYPREPVAAAAVQRWLSVAAGELNAGPGAARLAALFGLDKDVAPARMTAARLFDLLDRHLAGRRFLVGDAPTLADIALYSYTAHAPEGGVALAPYPELRAWLLR
ncbi:MAG: glutathione S-transferase family protein, partial [Alphaproteobacteria bacterium]